MPMSIREEFEKRERSFMSPFACPSSQSRGRRVAEKPCAVRTAFQLDRDRIVYCNAFRRLKHKTQVFLAPMIDDYRTRLTHTLEVSQMARAISRALYLNEDLTEAIALGHDLGHTPFGHSGETVLKEIYSPDFTHSEQSIRVVEVLENGGLGLNLHERGASTASSSTPRATARCCPMTPRNWRARTKAVWSESPISWPT